MGTCYPEPKVPCQTWHVKSSAVKTDEKFLNFQQLGQLVQISASHKQVESSLCVHRGCHRRIFRVETGRLDVEKTSFGQEDGAEPKGTHREMLHKLMQISKFEEMSHTRDRVG